MFHPVPHAPSITLAGAFRGEHHVAPSDYVGTGTLGSRHATLALTGVPIRRRPRSIGGTPERSTSSTNASAPPRHGGSSVATIPHHDESIAPFTPRRFPIAGDVERRCHELHGTPSEMRGSCRRFRLPSVAHPWRRSMVHSENQTPRDLVCRSGSDAFPVFMVLQPRG